MDNHGVLKMSPTDSGGPLTFHLAPPAGQSFHLFSEISQHLLEGLAQCSVQTILRLCILMT